MIIHRLIVPLTAAFVAAYGGAASAQGAFPAPLPGQAAPQGGFPAPLPNQAGRPPANDPAFPPVNGAPQASVGAPAAASPFPSAGAAPLASAPSGPPVGGPPGAGGPPDACMKGFVPLREEAEKRGKQIKAASDRHAPPAEACKLLGNFSQSETKMIKYIEANATKCGIPAQVADQMKAGHKNTEAMQKKVCDIAQQAATRGPAGPSLSEALGSSASLPEATPNVRKGGSTFDTLNGNVLSR